MVRYNLKDIEELEDTADAELERLAIANTRTRMNAANRREAQREADRINGRRNGGRK